MNWDASQKGFKKVLEVYIQDAVEGTRKKKAKRKKARSINWLRIWKEQSTINGGKSNSKQNSNHLKNFNWAIKRILTYNCSEDVLEN